MEQLMQNSINKELIKATSHHLMENRSCQAKVIPFFSEILNLVGASNTVKRIYF